MKLSIVMMMKNEEKNLNRTLSALDKLRNNIESELIILDTGSTDKSAEIAREYTGKVFFKEWNNDFASMRNESLKYAKGEWILVLDADEVITDYSRLYEFFESNLHTKYNSATLDILNIHSKDPLVTDKCQVIRFFRNIDGFKYEGIVHEQPTYKYPVYNNIISCDHYGYFFVDEELNQKKANRNKKLLERQYNEEPKNVYILYQLSKTHSQLNDYEDAFNMIQLAYKYSKEKNKLYEYVNSRYMILLISKSEFIKAKQVGLEYYKISKKNIDNLYMLGLIESNLYNFNKAKHYFERYLYYIDNYDQSDQYNSINIDCNFIAKKEEVQGFMLDIHIKEKKYERALKFIEDNKINIMSICAQYICSVINNKDIKKIKELYLNQNKKSDKLKISFLLESYLNNNTKSEDKEKFYEMMSDIDDNYGYLNKYRIDKKYNDYLNEMVLNCNELYLSDIIKIYFDQNKSIINNLHLINDESLFNKFKYLVNKDKSFAIDLKDYILNIDNTLDINRIKVNRIITKVLVKSKKFLGDVNHKLFNIYNMYSNIYLRNIYSTNDYRYLLNNKEDLLIYYINELNNREVLGKISLLKELTYKYTNYSNILKEKIKAIEKENNITSEMLVLREQFLQNINNCVGNVELDVLNKLIDEYIELFGEDDKIYNVKGVCSIYQNDLESAEKYLKEALVINLENYDVMFNVAYVKELKNEFDEAILFYKYIKQNSSDEELVNLCIEKLNS
ncbi:MAG: glycosyltransferase [Peptostreptococcaceae bacterium]